MDQESIQEELHFYVTAALLFIVPFSFNYLFCVLGALIKVAVKRALFAVSNQNAQPVGYVYSYKYAFIFSITPTIAITIMEAINHAESTNTSTVAYFGLDFFMGLIAAEISANIINIAKWLKAMQILMKTFKANFNTFSDSIKVASEFVESEVSKPAEEKTTSQKETESDTS